MRLTSQFLREMLADLVGRRLATLWDVVDAWVVLAGVAFAVVYAVRRGMRSTTRSGPTLGREPFLQSLRHAAGGDVRREYRPADGSGAVYRFRFVRQADGSWRSYILSQPGYGHRDASGVVTHRLTDVQGRYVCFEPEPRSLYDAGRVAATWAEATQRYLRTGRF